MPIMKVRRLIGPRLSTQFLIHPGDAPLLREPGRFRIVPVRQISPVLRLCGLDGRGGRLSAPDADGEVCLGRMMRTLAKDRGWDIGLFPVAESELDRWCASARAAGLGVFVRRYDRRFHLLSRTLPVEDLLLRTSANTRKTLRQAERRADAAGFSVTVETGASAVANAMVALDRAALQSWKSGDSTNPDLPVFVPWEGALRDFVGALLDTADPRQEPVLVTAHGPDGATAAQLWLRRDDRLMAVVTYFDPALHAFSPGRRMLVEALGWAQREGIAEVDFNATSTWVAPFSDRVESFALVTVTSRSLWGRLMKGLVRLVDRWQARS